MREQAFRFGRAHHLVGIVGRPIHDGQCRVGTIVLNAGLVHHIGPFRLHVNLTRRLNAAGYPTLRFDLSTLGDSGASGAVQTRDEQVLADVGDGMALLSEQAGCNRFVLVGLCSGACNAQLVASADERVAGAVLLDGHAFRTAGFHLRHYAPRLLDPRRWWRRIIRVTSPSAAQTTDAPSFDIAAMPKARVRNELSQMLSRGLRLCLINSGGISRAFNHARQFRECFGRVARHPHVETAYLRETDHTYILSVDRERLLERIRQWHMRNFPIQAGGSRA